MPRKIEDVTWNLSQAAHHTGIARNTLRRRLEAAGHKTHTRAQFSPKQVIEALLGSLEAERIRKTREEADRLELENAQARKMLMTSEHAKEIYRKPLAPISQDLKDMPARLAGRCNPSDPILAREELDEYVEQLFEKVRKACEVLEKN